MELESKLHSLSVESDKLHSQLSNLDKQDERLKATKAELQHQVRQDDDMQWLVLQ